MTGNKRQKLQAVFGALLLITVGPVAGLSAGGEALLDQAGNAGNQPTGGGAENQPVGDTGQRTSWNDSTAPNASQIATLRPRANMSKPYAVVTDQPTDPDTDGLYEDVNGDGVINIVDSDALRRHLDTTTVGANWTAYDYTGDNRTDVGDVRWLFARSSGVPINDRDADGLPNSYELNVTGTDPDVADTDGDGVIDGEEDWDNDTLSAYREYQLGTDPYSVDSDGDGLSDTMESYRRPLDPADNDSDNDGTPDGQEDLDGDGLAAANETELGTVIGINDTDGDGLNDGPEVHKYGTNATLYDTDSDGLSDSDELTVGTDPTDPDTDNDTVLDGNETFTTATGNETLNATVSITGQGNVAGKTEVTSPSDVRFTESYAPPSSVSSHVEFSSYANFSSANITLGYNASALANESDAAIYWFNESLGTYERLNSTVDANNNTVTATTTHFSTYVVFNESSWQEYLADRSALNETISNVSALPAAPKEFVTIQNVDPSEYPNITVYAEANTSSGRNGALAAANFSVYESGNEYPVENLEFTEDTRVDVVFAFDDTGSMGDEITDMQSGVENLTTGIEAAGIDARYGLVSFKDDTEIDQPLTDNVTTFQQSVDGLFADGGGDGPEDSLDAIAQAGELDFRNGSQRVIVHITDYDAHSDSRTSNNFTELETQLRTSGTAFYTVAPEFTDFDGLANDTGGVWVDIYDSDFRVVLDNLQASLTSRYAITYDSPRPSDGTGRRVDLYVNDSDVGVANDTDAYVAPDGVQGDCTGPDSDDDGISDYCETTGIPLANGPTVTTDPMDPDTDGDGLSDGTELRNLSSKQTTATDEFIGYNWVSNPNKTHTDNDSLSDGTEYNGWEINVTTDNVGDPLRWAKASEGDEGDIEVPTSTINVTSDPKTEHSDGDQLADGVERTETHTDPREAVTYRITNNHDRFITELDDDVVSVIMPPSRSMSEIRGRGLTDRTDDFDFIRVEEATLDKRSQLIFESIDGTERSDVWFNNERELEYDTDPWDPDTDDDGLTDGWEVDGITVYNDGLLAAGEEYIFRQHQPYGGTDPTNPDTDDDGYWDGWIGVYGTNYTDDVILYRENLEDGQEDSEIVPEQTELHEVPNDQYIGVDIDGDGRDEHSKVHIGERQWDASPTDGDSPNLGVGVEADFVEGLPNNRLNNEQWVTQIEENYGLYGITLDIKRDDTIGGNPLEASFEAVTSANDENRDLYLLVTTERADGQFGEPWGFNTDATVETMFGLPANGHMIFAETIADDTSMLNIDQSASPYQSETATVAGFVEMHELAHSFNIGRADDVDALPEGEVYSGYEGSQKPDDPTPERYQDPGADDWSIMRAGFDRDAQFTYNESGYYVFSIEELATIEHP